MQWFKGRYVQSLEMEISRLRTELVGLQKYNKTLIDRLLVKSGSQPTVELPDEATPEALDKMLKHQDIFEDIDEVPDDGGLTDNRKERFDEFVS